MHDNIEPIDPRQDAERRRAKVHAEQERKNNSTPARTESSNWEDYQHVDGGAAAGRPGDDFNHRTTHQAVLLNRQLNMCTMLRRQSWGV
jgi:hypothetical protein